MTIHKSATRAFSIHFANGNENTLYLSSNHNTGEAIVWQSVKYFGDYKPHRPRRVTGKNIVKFVAALKELPVAEASVVIHDQASYEYIMGAKL